MNWYEEKQSAKAERLRNKASKLKEESDAFFSKTGEEHTGIPFGQPILIGHHSEKRHRNALKRFDAKINKAIESGKESERCIERAEAIENNSSISSDDPEAIVKLKAKLKGLETYRQKIKDYNKEAKKEGKEKYASYILTNLGANIRSVKQRITFLESQQNKENKEYEKKGIRIVENVEVNRLQMFFDGKPSDEIRSTLKSNGFRWSPNNGCWQRMGVHNGSMYALENVLEVCS